jgi:hypothetical protein
MPINEVRGKEATNGQIGTGEASKPKIEFSITTKVQ